jgi:ADP-ribosylglycohydrolase
MLGSILGDIIGSRFEFMSTQEKDVTLFHPGCSWTDDTVLTYAVSKVCAAIKENKIDDDDLIEKLFVAEFRKVVKDFPMAGWGKRFFAWASAPTYTPNDSAGNGCLMRISPVVFYFKDLETIQRIGRICTKVSHNHPDSYKSVEAFLEILHYLFNTVVHEDALEAIDIELRKKAVKEITEKHGFVVEPVESLHAIGGYWGLAKDTLPRALSGYLESNGYEDVMRNMLYIGSDTDTTATVAGGLAELTYSLKAEDINNLYRYFDHKSFYMVKQICEQYIESDNKDLWDNLLNDETKEKIQELVAHKPVDQTAQWDPLELPSDEEYYKLEPGFSFKKLMLKLFGRY